MKTRIVALMMLAALLLLLTGCSGGISSDETKTHVGTFFEAVEAGDYAAAEACLHPERPADLAEYFTGMEAVIGQPFSAGVTVADYTGFRSALYDSTVGGSTYTLMMKVTVGIAEVDAEIEVVRNDAGFGIYNLSITP